MKTWNAIQSFAFRGVRFLLQLQTFWIVLLVVGVGILLGQSIDAGEQGEVTASIVVVIAVLMLSLYKPLASVMAWIFFFPFLETVIKIPLGKSIPDLSYSRFTIAFLVIAMLARGVVGKLRIAKFGPVEYLIVASTLGIAFAAPMSLPTSTGVYQTALAWYFTPFIAYFFTKNLVKSHKDVKAIFWAIALLGTASALYAAYEYATGNILFLPRGIADEDLVLYRADSGIRLIVGIWGSAGSMGRILAMCIPVTLYLYLEHKARSKRKLLLTGMLGIQAYSIVICMVRAPWLALLIAFFVIQLFDLRFRRLFILIVIVGAILVGLTWDRVSESSVAARLNDDTSTYEGRQDRWQAGLRMWLASPVRGWGFGRFEKEGWRFRPDGSNTQMTAPENDYLVVMIGSGLLGILPYLGVLLVPLWYGLRLIAKARSLKRQGKPWPGFVKVETLAVPCAVIVAYLVFSFSAANVVAGSKLILMSLAGAVVGTHEHLLRRPKRKEMRSRVPLNVKATSTKNANPSLTTQRLNIRGQAS